MLSGRLGSDNAVARKDCLGNSPMLVKARIFYLDPQHFQPKCQLKLLVNLFGRLYEGDVSRGTRQLPYGS